MIYTNWSNSEQRDCLLIKLFDYAADSEARSGFELLPRGQLVAVFGATHCRDRDGDVRECIARFDCGLIKTIRTLTISPSLCYVIAFIDSACIIVSVFLCLFVVLRRSSRKC